jgi:FkbM family methyltransferase
MSVAPGKLAGAGQRYRRRGVPEVLAHYLPQRGVIGEARRRLRPLVNRWLASRVGSTATLPSGEQVAISPLHRHITWNPEEYAAFRAATRPGAIVLDIGANVGAYALLFAKWVGPSGHVYAFEPDPRAADGLRSHIALNRLENRITVIEQAIGNAGWRSMPFLLDRSSGLSRRLPPAGDSGAAQVIDVPAISIDAFCCERRVVPDLIKVDAEGAELSILQGARRTIALAARKLQLFVEMHSALWPAAGHDLSAIQQEFARQGLVPERLDGDRGDVWTAEGVCLRIRRDAR